MKQDVVRIEEVESWLSAKQWRSVLADSIGGDCLKKYGHEIL
jgi:hypothetical protein